MPARWFVPILGADPTRVKSDHVHAAVSGWFDHSPAEHAANDKPYAVSPLTSDTQGVIGVEIATLTDVAGRRLWEAIESGTPVRLGNQTRPVGRAKRLHEDSWSDLAARGASERQWTIELVTPTTFRSGDRSSPLPSIPTLLGGAARAWSLWSGLGERQFDGRRDGALWVSDLDLSSTVVEIAVRDRSGRPKPVHLSCSLGSVGLRCDDPPTAERVGPLIRLAAYAGVGSMRGRGLGVARVSASGLRDLRGARHQSEESVGATG